VVELNERLEHDTEAFAIIEEPAMMVGNSPWPGIEIKALLELAGLPVATEFGIRVAAPERPVATSSPVIELQNPDLVSRLVQLQRGRHASKPGAQDKDRSTFRITVEPDRPLVPGIGREAEAGHCLIHRGAA
jgi:hypothetical protein